MTFYATVIVVEADDAERAQRTVLLGESIGNRAAEEGFEILFVGDPWPIEPARWSGPDPIFESYDAVGQRLLQVEDAHDL